MAFRTGAVSGPDDSIDEYWDWFAVALFLLTSVDLVTTVYAAHVVGLRGEANPLMRWLLSTDLVTIVTVHLAAVVSAALLFELVIGRLAATPAPYARYLERALELWLGLLCAAGLFVFANNLSVIFFGAGLL